MQSLISQVQQLGAKSDFWSSAVNWLIFCTALVGILYFGATIRQSAIAKRLRIAQEALVKAKDDQLSTDLKAKDSEIAAANKKSAEANERSQKLEQENLKLESAINPRRLADKQQTALASLAAFAGRVVEVKSYSSDTEGLILASQIVEALGKSHISIIDNRLTMQPAGSISFGVSVSGTNKELTDALKSILANFSSTSSLSTNRGFSASVSFGVMTPAVPPAAVIEVGPKPIK